MRGLGTRKQCILRFLKYRGNMLLRAVLLLFLCGPALSCPADEDIAPHCQCNVLFGFHMMICKDFDYPDQMMEPFRAVARSEMPVFSLSIEKSSLEYIPSEAFKNTKLRKLRFAETQVMSLSDTDLAFEGLEDSLEEIRATSEQYVASWNWNQLRNMKVLQLIEVSSISMGAIEEKLPELPSLKFLGIVKADISFIVDGAFQSLESLSVLNLQGNDLVALKRNQLPNPAKSLTSMDLSFNKLTELPEDFFTNMPVLDYVRLESNNFMLLPEKTFALPFKQVTDFILIDNPIRCDCRLRWMVTKRNPTAFLGTCAAPKQIKGLKLVDVKLKHLWC